MGLWLGAVEEYFGGGDSRLLSPGTKRLRVRRESLLTRAKCSEEAASVEQAEANGETWRQGLEQQDHNDGMDSMGSHSHTGQDHDMHENSWRRG